MVNYRGVHDTPVEEDQSRYGMQKSALGVAQHLHVNTNLRSYLVLINWIYCLLGNKRIYLGSNGLRPHPFGGERN